MSIIIDGGFSKLHKCGHPILIEMSLGIPPHLPPIGPLSQLAMS